MWLLLLLAAATAGAQPKLVIPGGLSFEFGDVYGTDATRVVPILNQGSDTLAINSVSASCGCTAALISKSHIAPGDTGFLSIKFDARRFSGIVHKTVSLQSNDTAHKHINIAFGVNVVKTLMFDPEYLYYTVDVDSPVTDTLTIANVTSDPMTILSITPSSDAVAITINKKTIPPSGEAKLTATFRATTAGTHKGNIEILTDHPKNPLFTVRYFALAKAPKGSH